MIELKPCPFCGQKAEIYQLNNKFESMCTNCTATIEWLFESEQEAAEAWNRRVNDSIEE